MTASLSPLFKTFVMAGFESATFRDCAGMQKDMIAATQHDRQMREDYALVSGLGIRVVRDQARWDLIDKGFGTYDFSTLEPVIAAARAEDMQVILDLFHYGYPDDLDIFSDAFVGRYAAYAGAVAQFVADRTTEIPFYTPINEISFFSWAAGDIAIFRPCERGRGGEIKRQLVRAGIAGMDAIRAVDPRARFVLSEPLIHVVTPLDRPELAGTVATIRESQFEAYDMLSGRKAPELGGHPRYLDILGENYYHDNQWEHDGKRLFWHERPQDPRRLPLRTLLTEVARRYPDCPLILTETGHFGAGRAQWLREIVEEIRNLPPGVNFQGVCLYPAIDRPDWHDGHLHNSGLADFAPQPDGTLRRVLHQEYAAEARRALQVLRPH